MYNSFNLIREAAEIAGIHSGDISNEEHREMLDLIDDSAGLRQHEVLQVLIDFLEGV